uniref:Protein PIP-1 n=1 Tax=Sus scrofa TaxID=9823 RepID=PIP1_PIG|nr:RecName: Full=Protein PIP-1; Flags: Precursor [Sus scrofa]
MGKCLLLPLLLVVLSSLLGFPQALECFQCQRVSASGVCESGKSFCQTQGSQQCFLRKVYEGDTVSYGHQGCSSLCVPMKFFRPNVTVDFRCCHDSPFCNKF